MITDIEKNRIDNPINKQKISIVVVGYNRVKSIQRLLSSLLNAQYPHNDIPLVISIDCSGCTELYDYVQKFKWPHGEKYVVIQEKRLGLKEHIFRCGDLTKLFKAIILLEDDLFVSPYFYDYVHQAIEKYEKEERIAQIALYKNERNGYVGLPYEELYDGCDVFLRQSVCSWGQCWTDMMWAKFMKWHDSNDMEEKIRTANMPEAIKGWERAWSKYFYAYLLDTNRYVLHPHVSLSTNFSDAGEHSAMTNTNEQVSLVQGNVKYKMYEFKDLVKYDVYFNNEYIYEWLGISRDDLVLDMYGFYEHHMNKKYILTTKKLPYQKVKSFGLLLRPWELNIKYNISGEGIYLFAIDKDTRKSLKGNYSKYVASYFWRGYNGSIIRQIAKVNIKNYVCLLSQRIINKLQRILNTISGINKR